MRSLKLMVENREGLHARPASLIMQCASSFESQIYFILGNEKVNARSMMSVISLSAVKGTQITVEIEGIDEVQAEEAMVSLFRNNFYEE